MTGRPPLWTPEEARADAEREGERELTPAQKVAADLGEGCAADGCISLLPLPVLVVGLFYLVR